MSLLLTCRKKEHYHESVVFSLFRRYFKIMEDSKNIIIQAKNARIIAILAEKFDGSLDKAMDVFYKSATAQMIQDGVADLHCRSDHYLADEIYREYSEDSE